MKITKVLPLSGKETTLDLAVTEEQLLQWKMGDLGSLGIITRKEPVSGLGGYLNLSPRANLMVPQQIRLSGKWVLVRIVGKSVQELTKGLPMLWQISGVDTCRGNV
jgi:hypothetical protein